MNERVQRPNRLAEKRKPRSTADIPRRVWAVVLAAIAAAGVVGLLRANVFELTQHLVEIRELPDSLSAAGFSLASAREVKIDIAGRDRVRLSAGNGGTAAARLGNVWMIDARTRERVWDLRARGPVGGSREAPAYHETVVLPEGQYVLYCSVQQGDRGQQDESWVSWLDRGGASAPAAAQGDSDSEGFYVTVTGRGRRLSASDVLSALETPIGSPDPSESRELARSQPSRSRNPTTAVSRRGNALVDLTRLKDNEARFAHFSLSRETDVTVRAIGEGSNGEMDDFGWIVNTANGRAVWEMKYEDTEHAGGSSRNRLSIATISLRRGTYVVYFVTNDSHSYDDWNARAPDDEEGWGIVVAEANRSVGSDDGVRRGNSWTPIAQLIDIRDGVRRRARFTLDRRADIRIYALGEGDRTEMYDYAWIEGADTRSTIWEMTYRNSERAGGASKNRLFNDTVRLPAGEYILRYVSDDSHSPESWNADPPNDARNYGVTVYVEGRNR